VASEVRGGQYLVPGFEPSTAILVHMTSTRRAAVASVLALLAVVPTTAAVAYAGAPENTKPAPEHTKVAAQIFADALSAMKRAKSFHVTGRIDAGGTKESLNLSMSPSGGGGSIGLPGVTMQIIVMSKSVYIKADEKSWFNLTHSQSTAALVANRWIKAKRTNPDFRDFVNLTVSTSFIGQVTSGSSSFTKLPGTRVFDGRRAVVLVDSGGGRLYVADSGSAYFLYLQGSGGGSSGTMTFTDFDSAPMPAVPVDAIPL
jgi:hypothetical protein